MKKMDAKEFIELDSVAFEDVTFRQGDTIKIHIEVLYKIMEQYHQSKVNDVVLDDVIKCDCELERHERAKMELDYNKCMDCEKEIQ